MNRRQKIIVSITGIFIVLLALVGLTYAYFLTRITGNENEKSISVTTADLRLTYLNDDGGIIGGQKLLPSDTEYTKTFSVKNTGNEVVEYGVFLINVVNTFELKDDIKYTLTCTTDGDLPCGTAGLTTFPSGISSLATATIESNKTHNYTFTFTYKDSGSDQSIDMNKELEAKLQIFAKDADGEFYPYEEDTLAYNVINNIRKGNLVGKSSFSPNLSAVGMSGNGTNTEDKILSTAQDNYGESYYFRGNPIDNYVNFAGMCWRIVRIQGDGSTKLVLASELECSEENLTSDSGFITDGVRGIKGNLVSGIYGYREENGLHRNDYINNQANTIQNVRVILNNWLNRKITTDEQKLLKNDEWCISDYTNGDILYGTKTPTYKCNMLGMTIKDKNKIGMLTIDEVIYAGGPTGEYDFEEGKNYYLNNNTLLNGGIDRTTWYTLTLAPQFDIVDQVYVITDVGTITVGFDDMIYAPNYAHSIQTRAVISLKSGVEISDGVGTISDPYVVNN